MENTEASIKFNKAFESVFGDFQPTKKDMDDIDAGENANILANLKNIKPDIEDYIDLVNDANKAFEKEALNVEPIYIGNVDHFMKDYKQNIFRTKKSMKVIQKKVRVMKGIKEGLKQDIKVLMAEFKERRKVRSLHYKC